MSTAQPSAPSPVSPTVEAEAADVLASFVPALLRQRLALNPSPPREPAAETLQSAVLFADIRGFTALAERLATRGAAGAEALSELLAASFGRLLDAVHRHGGSVLRFPGDAAIALWPAPDDAGLTVACAQAAACGLDLQREFSGAQAPGGLRLRVGVAGGELQALTIGGVRDRWEWLVVGEAVRQAGQVNAHAPVGRVALAASVFTRLAGIARADPVGTEPTPFAWLLQDLSAVPAAPATGASDAAPLSALQPFVPRGARALLAAGQLDWLAELRRVSVLFAAIPPAAHRDLATLQAVFSAVQQAIYHFGGSLNQSVADDKGTVVVAGWGLPGAAHEDNAQRAFEAAVAMHAAVKAHGLDLDVGVSTGLAFCGLRGGPRRREYSMIGDTVNLAARLMQAAGDGVLCDETTRAAAGRLRFEPGSPLRLKGKDQPVAVFRPAAGRSPGDVRPAAKSVVIGRRRERARLAEKLAQLLDCRQPCTVLIEGEAGLGKSSLVADLIAQAAKHPVRVLRAQAGAIERGTPYHAWRTTLEDLLDLAGVNDVTVRQQRARQAFGRAPELAARVGLLEAVIHLGFPPDPALDRFSGPARAEAVRELITHVLTEAAGRHPLVLVLEDAHWLDGASWSLVQAAATLEAPILLVVSSRPLEEPVPAEAAAVLASPTCERLPLGPLGRDEIGELLCARLGVRALPESVISWVGGRADGNPFFSEELALALRDLGVLDLSTGEGRWVGGTGDLAALDLPATVQGIVTSRIDRLPPPEALALKVASVIGRGFAARWLSALLPVRAEPGLLDAQLGHLVALDLLQAAVRDYQFKHAITQDVAYGLLPYALRRELHQRLALWIEQEQSDDLAAAFGVLAHHWTNAENTGKALDYLDRAGCHSLRAGAHREAAGFFSRALALAGSKAPATPALQTARWQRQLADALWGLGDLAGAVEQSRQTLATLGHRAPRSRRAWAGLLACSFARHASGGRTASQTAGARAAAAEAALGMQRIAERHYYAQDALPLVAASLSAANLSDAAGAHAPVTRSYGMLGLVCGLVGLHGTAERYLLRAVEHAKSTDDLAGLVFAHYAYGGYLIGRTRWEDLRGIAEAGVRHARDLGDPQETEVALTVAGHLAFYTGEYRTSLAVFEQVRQSAGGRSPQHTAWGHYAAGRTLVFRGDFTEAITHLEQARELLRPLADDMSAIICTGLLALAHLRRGDLVEAEHHADAALRLILANAPSVFAYVEPYAAVLEVRLARCCRDGASTRRLQDVRVAAGQLRKLSFLFPLARARFATLQGLRARLAGREWRARACLLRAVRLAERYQLPWDYAHACHHLSRSPALPTGEQAAWDDEAGAAFARLESSAHRDALSATAFPHAHLHRSDKRDRHAAALRA